MLKITRFLELGNKYGYYTHDVRVPYPPKHRSKIWKLPVHGKLIFVTNGHINKYTEKKPEPVPVTAVVFAKCNTYKMIHNFTKAEFDFLVDNQNQIREMFKEQAALRDQLELQDQASKHVCK